MLNISSDNFFTTENLDRIVEKRHDENWISEKLIDPETKFIPLWQSKNLFNAEKDPYVVFLTKDEIIKQKISTASYTLIGELNNQIYFSFSLPDDNIKIENAFSKFGIFSSIRRYGVLLPKDEASLLGYANAIDAWEKNHRFCGKCGRETILEEAGHKLICSNNKCDHLSFPRTDPAIITVVYKDDECLLVRQPHWQKAQYALVAGFVEPGESLESAVAREIFEETGITVDEIIYQSSQPWPFPTSIMLGFYARALTQKITFYDKELEDAKWMTRKEIINQLNSGELKLPTRFSIAYKLFESWFNNNEFNLIEVLNNLQ